MVPALTAFEALTPHETRVLEAWRTYWPTTAPPQERRDGFEALAHRQEALRQHIVWRLLAQAQRFLAAVPDVARVALCWEAANPRQREFGHPVRFWLHLTRRGDGATAVFGDGSTWPWGKAPVNLPAEALSAMAETIDQGLRWGLGEALRQQTLGLVLCDERIAACRTQGAPAVEAVAQRLALSAVAPALRTDARAARL